MKGDMNIPTHLELGGALLPAFARAARLELGYFRGGLDVQRKADASPVTIADQEAEAIILEVLADVAPDVPIIAEEQYSAGIIPDVDGTLFLVDALDGTRAFVKGDADFTINVALVVDRVPVFGMILLPVSGELYVTLQSDRAARTVLDVNTDTGFDEVDWTDIRVRIPDRQSLVVALSNSHPSSKLEKELADKPIGGRIEAGSSLKFCRVAEGKADLYPRLGSISEWDIAAGHAILRAAGGEVTRMDGSPLRYGNDDVKYRTPAFVGWGGEVLSDQLRFKTE
jgi:3'(2'), 5'-bisphosphate nucleotidase